MNCARFNVPVRPSVVAMPAELRLQLPPLGDLMFQLPVRLFRTTRAFVGAFRQRCEIGRLALQYFRVEALLDDHPFRGVVGRLLQRLLLALMRVISAKVRMRPPSAQGMQRNSRRRPSCRSISAGGTAPARMAANRWSRQAGSSAAGTLYPQFAATCSSRRPENWDRLPAVEAAGPDLGIAPVDEADAHVAVQQDDAEIDEVERLGQVARQSRQARKCRNCGMAANLGAVWLGFGKCRRRLGVSLSMPGVAPSRRGTRRGGARPAPARPVRISDEFDPEETPMPDRATQKLDPATIRLHRAGSGPRAGDAALPRHDAPSVGLPRRPGGHLHAAVLRPARPRRDRRCRRRPTASRNWRSNSPACCGARASPRRM